MTSLAAFFALATVALLLYAYVGYPVLLWLIARLRRAPAVAAGEIEWPRVSISLPAYNEVSQIRDVLETLLRIDYPRDRLQILVISDASSDGTDEAVREYAERGIELMRMPKRSGKTAAENAGAAHLTGDIIVNTDASIRILPHALKPLIAQFADSTVGVASGRDVSVAAGQATAANIAESGYVGYEMQVRALETRCGGIIGASGCFYAVRAHLHRAPLPAHLSRDFASALIAREHGYRAVSVDAALCLVPRTSSLRTEYKRKVRTITRGMETLLYKRHLMNPFRHGQFAWMLLSHKITRWLVPCFALLTLLALIPLALTFGWALYVVAAAATAGVVAVIGTSWPAGQRVPRIIGLVASLVVANAATVHAVLKAMQQDDNAAWEPTRREGQFSAGPSHG